MSVFNGKGTEGKVVGCATGCGYVSQEDVQADDDQIIRNGDIGSLDATTWIPSGSVKSIKLSRGNLIMQSCVGRGQ